MSEFFSGVTFARQNTSPVDDAIIRKALISDGRLTGCTFSYIGNVLTMSKGQLIACGRQIRHVHDQSWTLNEASSGFARVLLTVDLSRTATRDSFDQVNTTVEYASAQDGFLALQQDDINASGTVYQMVLATLSIGAGGITGIVYEMEDSGSGGGRYSLLTVSTEDASLQSALVEVTGTDPATERVDAQSRSMAKGKVTFKLKYLTEYTVTCGGVSSKISIDAYADYTAAISLAEYLFSSDGVTGDEHVDVTGGWGLTGAATFQKSPYLYFKVTNATYAVRSVHTQSAVDLSKYRYIEIVVKESKSATSTDGFYLAIVTSASSTTAFKQTELIPVGITQDTPYRLDVSDISGSYYVALLTSGRYPEATVSTVVLTN